MAFMMIDDGWFCNDIDFWIGGMSIWQTFELSKRLSFHSQLYFYISPWRPVSKKRTVSPTIS